MNVLGSRSRITAGLVAFCFLPVVTLSLLAQSSRAGAARPAPPRAERVERAVPFKVGERLVYDVAWSPYLTAGTAVLTVQEQRAASGSRAYYVVGEAKPRPLLSRIYNLYYKGETFIDVYTLLPQRGVMYAEEGSRRATKITRFDHSARRVEYEMHTATLTKKSLPVPAYTQDALSVLYAVRALRLRDGAKVTIPVSDSGEVYTVEVSVGPSEPIASGLGSLPAWRLTPRITDSRGEAQDRPMTLWLTTDARRLPVKMEVDLAVGKVSLVLQELRGA